MDADPLPGINTLSKALNRWVEKNPNGEFLGTRVGNKYEWLTYREVQDISKNLGKGIVAFDMVPGMTDDDGKAWKFMGIMAKNRKEWNLVNHAGMYQGVTTVAFYDTLSQDATSFIVNQTELTTIACSVDMVKKLSKFKVDDAQTDEKNMRHLAQLIVFENTIPDEEKKAAEEAGLTLYTFEQVIFKGREATAEEVEAQPDDVFMFSYTSGTTGVPKGVMLSHRMILGSGSAIGYSCGQGNIPPLGEKDSYISYLPAAHSFEQCLIGCSLVLGLKIGFFGGNVLKLTEDA